MNLVCGLLISSASIAMNRSFGITTPDQVIIEEYLNYHTHKIPLPKGENEIALSLDYTVLNEEFIVQAGIATD
ncbi:hypothetical protein [Pseudozobellia sp. WGM2]|uniref:hypothetical protein n=1 Tax=Pseudozobellia sp. WGM2 TaxID=2787625 RepID=UPI001ADF7FE7|nr:hypothetical protein [Pseudozobellia sp. WGM2]